MDNGEQNKRLEKRAHSTMALDLGKTEAMTRDISASGIFFEMDAKIRLESPVNFEWDFDSPQGTMMLKCQGNIVRVEPRGSRVGVAVKITESAIEPVW